MNTCKTCKHWGTEGDEPPWRSCERYMNEGGSGVMRFSPTLDGAGVHNGEPFNGGSLATGPDFGCIHWQGKIPATVRPEEV